MSLYSNVYASSMRPIPGRESEMKLNDAGGYVFTIPPAEVINRFAVLGTDQGSYYCGERQLTARAIEAVSHAIEEIKTDAVHILINVISNGLAPKLSPAIFALALCMNSSDVNTRRMAAKAALRVLKTQSMLLEWIAALKTIRGQGRLVRETIAAWYTTQDIDFLGYQMAKYRNRAGITTADALRMGHPYPKSERRSDLFKWAVNDARRSSGKPYEMPAFESMPAQVRGYEHARLAESNTEIARLIAAYGLTHEMVPNTALKDVGVWRVLIENTPPTALIRNLGKLTAVGAMVDDRVKARVMSVLSSADRLRRARIHPLQILLAHATYSSGHGFKGKLTWHPDKEVCEALEKAFRLSFAAVEPTGKRMMIALDVSQSMTAPVLNGQLSCRVAAMAMAMVTATVEPEVRVYGFYNDKFKPIEGFDPTAPLSHNLALVHRAPFGTTDCSLPARYCRSEGIEVDGFAVFTDNETWASTVNPSVAMETYRREMDLQSRLVVAAMKMSDYSIGDPKDVNTLNIAGFDASVPSLIANFVSRKV